MGEALRKKDERIGESIEEMELTWLRSSLDMVNTKKNDFRQSNRFPA